MFTLLFVFCMFGVFGKLFCFGLKAAWGISKFVLNIVFLPLILTYVLGVINVVSTVILEQLNHARGVDNL